MVIPWIRMPTIDVIFTIIFTLLNMPTTGIRAIFDLSYFTLCEEYSRGHFPQKID